CKHQQSKPINGRHYYPVQFYRRQTRRQYQCNRTCPPHQTSDWPLPDRKRLPLVPRHVQESEAPGRPMW
ncbi:hypothetical protein Trydic_g10273, partial [Trypoxylus dichotomus]